MRGQTKPPASMTDTLRNWLQDAPFGLAMSSGFFGFYAHLGVLSVLEEEDLLPARASGSSAGALITGCWAAGLDCDAIRQRLFSLNKADFWDPAPGLGLLRGARFRALLDTLLPTTHFAACRIPLALSGFDLCQRRTRVLTQGALTPAMYASCAVPLLFQPIRHQGGLLVDGGVADRPGLAGMQAGRVLYHHLGSRSPWRRKQGAHTRIPQRDGLISVCINNLPRVGPTRLHQGPQAWEHARSTFRSLLDQPLCSAHLQG